MKGFVLSAGLSALVITAFVGCQTAKLVPAAESAISVESSGFSPNGAPEHSTIDISLLFGNGELIKDWRVEIGGHGVTPIGWSGDGHYLPASLTWDGKYKDGSVAPEGAYTARLFIEYARTYQPVSLESRSFVLDVTPPSGTIALDPPQFTPSDQGVTQPMTLSIQAKSVVAKLDTWSLSVYDEAGGLFRSFKGQWPNAIATWDGMSSTGSPVVPTKSYKTVATVRDEYGNTGEIKANVPVSDIPVATGNDAVQPKSAGFSPTSATAARTMDLLLTFGNKEQLKSWKLSVSHAEQGVQQSWSGDSRKMPSAISWDGSTSAGVAAPEGAYTAILSIDYGKNFKPFLTKSRSFVLDVTPPAVDVSANPTKLTPDGKGGIQPVAFTLYASSSTAGIKDWTLSVLGAGGKPVATFNSTWPAASASWDGAIAGGGNANPTQQYTYLAKVSDEFGNMGTVNGSLATGMLPSVTGKVAVVPQSEGFSPNGDQVPDTIALSLSYGQQSAVKSWKLAISSVGQEAQKTYGGDASNLPASVTWEGKNDSGSLAPEGTYVATLSLDYGTVFAAASATSAPFVLDITPPAGSIKLSSPLFSPIESSDTITLSLQVTSPTAKIDSWSMDIFDPGGNPFKSFDGKWPLNQAVWDGKGLNGDMVQSAEDYQVVAKARDQFGNTGTVKATVPIDILVEKFGNGYRILASRIFFKAYTADYKDVPENLAQQNMTRLDALARKLDKFPGYAIRIVGHAVMINWDSPVLGKAEQEAILIPLSKARAEAVRKALLDRGLADTRFTTQGVGASEQLVPDSDYKDRWQNRRVALFLDKQ
jgi:flagellar hook assembly protein FlgD